MSSQFKTGTVEGTGSAINVEIGFQPDRVVLYNIDDAGSLSPRLEWNVGMGDDAGWKMLTIADNGTDGVNSSEHITSDGVSQYAGSQAANSEGFTIGADSDINASGETIVWEAYRAD